MRVVGVSRSRRLALMAMRLLYMALMVLLAPVLVFVADPLREFSLRRLTRHQFTAPPPGPKRPGRVTVGFARRRLLSELVYTDPVLIALGAPARWLSSRLPRRRARVVRSERIWPPPEPGEPPAGVREPRRPRPNPPTDHISLPEPKD